MYVYNWLKRISLEKSYLLRIVQEAFTSFESVTQKSLAIQKQTSQSVVHKPIYFKLTPDRKLRTSGMNGKAKNDMNTSTMSPIFTFL